MNIFKEMNSNWLTVIELSEKIGQLKMPALVVVFKNSVVTEKKK